MPSNLRYQSGATNIPVAGVTLPHNLIGTPDEFFATLTAASGSGDAYFLGVSQTNVVVAGNGVAVSAQVICAVNHTSIR